MPTSDARSADAPPIRRRGARPADAMPSSGARPAQPGGMMVQGMGAGVQLATSVCELGLIPGDLLGRLPTGYAIPIGEQMACVVEAGRPWQTLFTSMFLHGGWLHLIGNLWFLWVFGNNVEDAMGHVRFFFFYVLCGVAAAVAQVVVDPSSPVPMVGASGAISGVMGAYAILYPRVRIHTLVAVPAWVMLGYWFLLQLLSTGMGEVGGVAFWAHIGGFLAGVLLVYPFRSEKLLADRARMIQARAWAGGGP
jgi:membrane associated rhomboid family serine protease